MSRFAVDLSKMPFPDVIEPLSFEAILAQMKTELQARWPFADLESEPLVAVLEVAAYYRTLDRARVNDASRAAFVALATGADLDNLAALFGTERLILSPADPDAVPPVAAVMEADDDFRRRVLLALEAQSTAGPRGSYLYHALSADPGVGDAAVVGPDDAVVAPMVAPDPGHVDVYVLGRTGAPSAGVVAAVEAALNAEDVRPLCDTVTVIAATVTTFAVTAQLKFYPGVDQASIIADAQVALTAFADAHFRLGHDITRSGIIAALYRPGVQNVSLTAPATDLVVPTSAARKLGTVSVTSDGSDV